MENIEITTLKCERTKKIELDDGFFVITADHDKGKIMVEYYESVKDGRGMIVTGKPKYQLSHSDPIAIYQTIIKHGLVKKLDHAAYLGRELTFAEQSLRKSSEYTQDERVE